MQNNFYITKDGKEVSSAVVVTDKRKLLAIVPYGKRNALDLPKGHIDKGEKSLDAAIRELYEETGMRVKESDLFFIGRFKYTSYKDIDLYLYLTNPLPDVNNLRCSSYFIDNWGREVPEATGFELTSFDDIRFYTPLRPLLTNLGKQLKKW